MAPRDKITEVCGGRPLLVVNPTGVRTARPVLYCRKPSVCWLFGVFLPNMWCGGGVTTLAAVGDRTEWEWHIAYIERRVKVRGHRKWNTCTSRERWRPRVSRVVSGFRALVKAGDSEPLSILKLVISCSPVRRMRTCWRWTREADTANSALPGQRSI